MTTSQVALWRRLRELPTGLQTLPDLDNEVPLAIPRATAALESRRLRFRRTLHEVDVRRAELEAQEAQHNTELEALRQALARADAENQDLRSELDAIHSAFVWRVGTALRRLSQTA